MDNNIITDTNAVHQAIADNQEAIDAFNRIVEYMNALEVKNGYLSTFIDDSRDAITDLNNLTFGEAVETLRADIADAGQCVEDNYALLEAVEAVEGCVEQYVAGDPVDIDLTPTSTINEDIKNRLERL